MIYNWLEKTSQLVIRQISEASTLHNFSIFSSYNNFRQIQRYQNTYIKRHTLTQPKDHEIKERTLIFLLNMSSSKVSSGWPLAESAHLLGYTLPETNIKFAIENGWLGGLGFSFQGRCWLRVLKNKPVKLHHFRRIVPNSGAKTGLVQLVVMRNGVLSRVRIGF